jgi:flavin reductase (DIM6/NTAB) family NADH-FMN oxidoreductase RutF
VTEIDVRTRQVADGAVPGPAGTPIRREFVDAMAANSTSVHVVSTADREHALGVTVSACTAVCADPPTLLVCINRRSPACRAIEANRVFAVNLLSSEQRHIADTFAGRVLNGKPFDFSCCDWTPGVLGAPLIEGVVASLECRLAGQYLVGTHHVFFGEVVAVKRAEHMPLLYCRRDYGEFQPLKRQERSSH